jgi:hypothetical protein
LVGVEGLRWMPARNAGGFRCREKKEKAKQPGRGGSIGFCSSARLAEEKEREREITWPGTKWRAAPACPTGRRGGRSGASARRGRARDGQRGQRGRWEEGPGDAWSETQSCRCSGAAGGRSHARRGAEEIGGSGKTMGDPVAKSRKHRGLTVKCGQLSHQCSNGDGPKSKNAGFFKSHNFALGFICKRAIVLKLV